MATKNVKGVKRADGNTYLYVDQAARTKIGTATLTTTAQDLSGAVNELKSGKADLDSGGKIPAAQLPSYVDDVLEYANKASFPATGETGKIYIDKATNKQYRWSGTAYVEISESLALGETSSTAYAGNKGKANADAIAVLNGTGAGSVSKAVSDAIGALDVSSVGGSGKYISAISETDGKISATATNFPSIPAAANNGTLTIQKNGTNVQTFTANQSTNATANITVPTKVSELTNDSGYTTNTGTVTSVKVGSTSYDPSSGVVSLPAYPTSLPASDTTSTYSASGTAPVNGTAVAAALGTLDVASVGGTGKYISAISETDGKISATAANMPTSLPASDVSAWAKASTKPSYTASEVGALSLAGGNMTGAGGIQYPTASGSNKSGNFISAGGGYSASSGKNGVKIIVCDQSDAVSGLGQDCGGLSGGYELSVIAPQGSNNGTAYISFLKHDINTPTKYTVLGYFNKDGNFYTTGSISEAGTALSSKYVEIQNNAGFHNSIYRGKYLGSEVTAEQWASISAGTFDDMYVGDYWIINGVIWRIASFDYFLHSGDTACETHHVVIVPDDCLYNAQLNTSASTEGGYVAVKTRGVLTNAETAIKSTFGQSHILSHRVLITNAVTDGRPSSATWQNSICDLMNEEMVYGTCIFRTTSDGQTIPGLHRIEKSQLQLFAYESSRIVNGVKWWLRDVAAPYAFAHVNGNGCATSGNANSSIGIRPVFCIKAA